MTSTAQINYVQPVEDSMRSAVDGLLHDATGLISRLTQIVRVLPCSTHAGTTSLDYNLLMTIDEMEAAVRQERAAIDALQENMSDSLKQHLQQATFWLDDVEGLFLDSARTQRRTPAQLERWLSYGAAPLEWAIKRRKRVEEILAQYGPNAELVGNG